MIIDKIKYTEDELQEKKRLEDEILKTLKEFKGTMPDPDEEEQLTLDHIMQNESFMMLMNLQSLQRILQTSANQRHLEELGTAEKIYEEALEIITALEKRDFLDYIKPTRKLLKANPVEKEKDVILVNGEKISGMAGEMQKSFKKKLYSYNFESAYAFILHQIKPYYVYLESNEDTNQYGNRYIDLLTLKMMQKARDDFGYKLPSQRKPTGKRGKQKVDPTADFEASEDAYSKVISNPVFTALALSIGETPEVDTVSNTLTIINGKGNKTQTEIKWDRGEIIEYEGIELSDKITTTAITSEQYLILNLMNKKLTVQLPTITSDPKKQKPIEEILLALTDEECRTVEITLDDYLKERDQDNRKRGKDSLSYAIKSLAYAEVKMDGIGYNLFSAKPQEMKYEKGSIKAIFNLDFCKAFYTGRLKTRLAYTPDPLMKIKLHNHPLGIVIYKYLQINYERNTTSKKQNPNANWVNIETLIDNIADLKERYEREKAGRRDYSAKVLAPLFRDLDALQDVYKVLTYEMLDKNHKPIAKSKFIGMKASERMKCRIRYEFTDYPNWKTPEGQQLTMNTKKNKKQ